MSRTAGRRPNVLLLLSDEHGFRHLSRLPPDIGEPVRTPTLDALASSGTVFEQAYCSTPLCTPSRISMLTGREPARCGAWGNDTLLPADVPTVAQALSAVGYRTALVGKMHLGGDRQLAGFQHRPYGDLTGAMGHQADPISPERRHPDKFRSRTADAGVTEIPESLLQEQVVCRESVAWLREHAASAPEQPWFLCASFSRPHFPLTAPRRHLDRYWPEGVSEPKVGLSAELADHPLTRALVEHFRLDEIDHTESQHARAAYFACVDYLDEILGDLLAVLGRDGLLEDTVIVYTTDHGELAGEHGLWWKQTWQEGSTRVPLIVQTPEQRAGLEPAHAVTTPVGLVDLLPTICGLTHAPVPDGVDGVDLSTTVRTGLEPSRGPVFSDRFTAIGAGTEFRMVRDGDLKYVGFRDAPELLFDLATDPLEQHNLAHDPARAAETERLRALVARTVDFDEAERRRLADRAERDARHTLRAERGTGSAYLLPDGRLVDADTTLYAPVVLAEDPAAVIADWPSTSTSAWGSRVSAPHTGRAG